MMASTRTRPEPHDCHTAELYGVIPPTIRIIGSLSEASQALLVRLASGERTSSSDHLAAHDLMRAVLTYGTREAPIVSQIGERGIMLSDLAKEALRAHLDPVLIAATGQLRSKYARSLMMALFVQGHAGMIEPTLSEMRKMLGVGSALRTSSHLWTRAILPAVRELMAIGWFVHVVDIRDRRARGKVNAYRVTWLIPECRS